MTTEYLSLKAHTPVKEALLLVKAQRQTQKQYMLSLSLMMMVN